MRAATSSPNGSLPRMKVQISSRSFAPLMTSNSALRASAPSWCMRTIDGAAPGKPKLSMRCSAQCSASERIPDQGEILRCNFLRPNNRYMGSAR